MFDSWARILTAVPNSVLWLLEDRQTVSNNLHQEIEARGIAPHRIIFAKRLELAEHLARHRQADLFLDTLPCNAHTTASDALWAGLPVLTQIGDSFSGRVAASLLNAIGLPELITHSQQEYEHLAITLAKNPEQLSTIKQKLNAHKNTHPLFDIKLFTKHIESAYKTIINHHQQNLLCDHIVIDA